MDQAPKKIHRWYLKSLGSVCFGHGKENGREPENEGKGEERVQRVSTQLCNGNLAPSLHSLCFLSASSSDLRLRTEFPPSTAAAHSISVAPSCHFF